MTRCAKSGWPVMGQSAVNSGHVKRTRYVSRGCGFGTFSSIALSGDSGSRVFAPSCVRVRSFAFAIVPLGGGNIPRRMPHADPRRDIGERAALDRNAEIAHQIAI